MKLADIPSMLVALRLTIAPLLLLDAIAERTGGNRSRDRSKVY